MRIATAHTVGRPSPAWTTRNNQQLADGLPDAPLEHQVVQQHHGDVQHQPRPADSEREGACLHAGLADHHGKDDEQYQQQRNINQGCGDAPAEQAAPVRVRVGHRFADLRRFRDYAHPRPLRLSSPSYPTDTLDSPAIQPGRH